MVAASPEPALNVVFILILIGHSIRLLTPLVMPLISLTSHKPMLLPGYCIHVLQGRIIRATEKESHIILNSIIYVEKQVHCQVHVERNTQIFTRFLVCGGPAVNAKTRLVLGEIMPCHEEKM